MVTQYYRYIGDRYTEVSLKQAECVAVRDERGKCIRGRNGAMLVRFADGRSQVVIGRLLRKIDPAGTLPTDHNRQP